MTPSGTKRPTTARFWLFLNDTRCLVEPIRSLKSPCQSLWHGESAAILGPNGVVKGSFHKLLTREARPEADPTTSCRLFVQELWSLEKLRHRIGVVMPKEDERFNPSELARNAVLSSQRGTCGFPDDKERTNRTMDLLEVGHLADREFGTLSSGERRRILIAHALVHEPEELVLNETSTAPDFTAPLQFAVTLRSLLELGREPVLVTHHPGEIPPEIQHIVLLQNPHLRLPERALSSGSERHLARWLVRRPACVDLSLEVSAAPPSVFGLNRL